MLARWNPYREMSQMRALMDRWMNDGEAVPEPAWSLALDVAEQDEAYLIKATIPGVKPEDIDVTFKDGVLSIRGDVKEDQEVENAHYHLRERRWGSFCRSIAIPTQVESDRIEASYDAGVLTLRLPKAEEVKPWKIDIKVA